MPRLVLVCLLVALALPARAQDTVGDFNQDYDPYVAALGMAVGYSGGTGLALRWPMLPQIMGGVAGGVWGSSEDLAWNMGFEAHLILRQAGGTRIYVGPAVAFYSDSNEDDTDTNASFSVGIEHLFKPRVALKFDLGFTYLGDDEKVFPMPQIAGFYYF